MPYEDREGDYGNACTALLDQDCLLDLPPSLSVALLSIPFQLKMEDGGDGLRSPVLALLKGFNPEHLRSLVLTTDILKHNNGEVR